MIKVQKYLMYCGRKNFWAGLLAISIISSISGCGNSLPETVGVHGKVTWRGQPLQNAMVTFEPIKDGPDTPIRPSKGYTDNSGIYKLSTFRTNDGAMPGKYIVLVHASDTQVSIDASNSQKRSLIPLKYGSSNTSDLSATVPTDGTESEINFDLTN